MRVLNRGKRGRSGRLSRQRQHLSHRHERFCREYLIDGCGKRAYVRAGYAPKAAEVSASQLLRIPKVADRIAELGAEQSRRLQFDADDVLRALIPLCTSSIADFIGPDGRLVEDLSQVPSEALAAVQSYRVTRRPDGTVSVSLKLINKISAIALAGRHVSVRAFSKSRDQDTSLSERMDAILRRREWVEE